MDLSTKYLGLTLPHPIVPSAAQPLTKDLDAMKRLEDAGAPAIVVHSLFEEQIEVEAENLGHYLEHGAESYAEALSYYPRQEEYVLGPDAYVDHIRQAIEVNPKELSLYRNLMAMRLRANDVPGAHAVIEQAIAAIGRTPALLVMQASVHEAHGKPEAAIALYEETLKTAPNAQVAANNLAMLLVEHRGDDENLARAETLARTLDKRQPAFLDTLGWVLFKRGALDESIEVLGEAVSKAPRAQEFRYHLAMGLLKKGETERARNELREALKGEPKYRGVEEAKSVLADLEKS